MSLLVNLIETYDKNFDRNPLIRFNATNFIIVEIDTTFRLRDDVADMVNMLTLETYNLKTNGNYYQDKPNYDIEIKNCYLEKPVMVTVDNCRGRHITMVKFRNCVFGNDFISKDEVYCNIYENCEWGSAL